MVFYLNHQRLTRRNVVTLVLLGLLASMLNPVPAYSIGVFGRVSSTSYFYEPRPSVQDPDPGTAMEQLGRLSFTVHDKTHKAWTLYYMGTARGDLLDRGLSGMKNRVYRGHLQYKPSRSLQVQLGRVWSDGGVGSGLVDGTLVRWRTRPVTLIVSAGTRGFNDPAGPTFHNWDGSGWDHSGQVGVFLRSRNLGRRLVLGGSWSRAMWAGREESEKVGLMANFKPAPGWTVFYENNYELNQEVFLRHHLRGHFRFTGGGAALSWQRQEGFEPAYATSYIFRKFRFEPWFATAAGREVQELRAHVLFQPESWGGWRLSADLVEIFPSGQERGDGLDLWAGRDLFRVGYRGMRGYRGSQDGFYGNISWWAQSDLRLWLDLNRISYAYRYEALPVDDPDRRTTMATRLGADFRVGQNWYFSGAVERLIYPGVKQDYRGLLKISYRFDLGARTQEVW